jgi:predicted transcriptional regulator
MFDAEDTNNQLFLTRTFQALASVNTRRILELLAQGPRGGSELLQVMDSTKTRIREAMQALQTVRLVSEGESRMGTVYRLDPAGLDLARSWLDRVDAIAGIRGEK